MAFKESRGEILILTDGDVYLGDGSINALIEPFKNEKVGVVSGRPVSLILSSNKWGYFSHLLTDVGAHQTRIRRRKKNKMIVCSGYLYSFRKKLISHIPESALSEDAIISHVIFEMGYITVYAPKAIVYVKYPTNLIDWIKQKKRSAGGYVQLNYLVKNKERMRSFSKEISGIFRIFNYPRTVREFIWTVELPFYRLHLWYLIFVDITIKKKKFGEIWVKVESTK